MRAERTPPAALTSSAMINAGLRGRNKLENGSESFFFCVFSFSLQLFLSWGPFLGLKPFEEVGVLCVFSLFVHLFLFSSSLDFLFFFSGISFFFLQFENKETKLYEKM